MADDSPCDDGAYCTVDDTCQDGECTAGSPRDCTEGDDDPCLIAECDEDLDACGTSSAPNGTVCIPTDLCQSNALCVNGQCLGAPLDCSGTPVTSPDCEAANCDPATGQCVVGPTNDGMPCTSGDLCESDKTCDMGVCAGTPIPSCTLCTETEQNQTYATANVDDTCAAWGGQISVVGDIDCFAVEVTVPGSRIYAETVDVGGSGCPALFDSVIRLFNSSGTQLASDDQSGVDSCSLFLPTNVGTTNLNPGTYSVCVEDWLNDDTTVPYLLLLDVLPPACGNAIVETPEECDGTALAGQTCVSQGFGSGTLTCDGSCSFDTSGCAAPFCGDGLLNGTEECDGTALGGATCVSEGFAAGTLACNAGCTFNTAGCTAAGCGNAILEFGEDCEGSALGCTSCQLFTCGAGQVPFSVSATGLPIPLVDVGTVTSSITVPTTGTLVSVGVQLNMTHTWDSDADIFLTPPGGAQFELSTDNGSSGDNYTNTVFSSNGVTAVATGTAPFTGVYAPEGSFTPTIGGPANGTWTLTVTDDLVGFIGTLQAWRVFGCIQP
ncbi:MAG: proprotein convertase P-domain-containing protein [Myxococcales bacterium]|nr:proprotein convertase P-domain-containing protein [Myxococcales bacterium]